MRNTNRHATKHFEILKPYGWLNTLYDVAQTNLFTKAPDNAIDSVRNENLYKVLTYVSYKSAKIEYENEVSKAMNDEAKAKAKSYKK